MAPQISGGSDSLGRCALPVLMQCLIAAVLGFLSGLGAGGGSLLILWLTFGAGMDQGTARILNLMFFIPSALIACWFRRKQGTLELRKILPAIVSGCTAAALFSWWGQQLELELLKKLFGGLLIFTGLRELFYRRK